MPARDGTGPMGAGPLTGRGMGPCGGGRAFGFGRGAGRGMGCGFGFGRGLNAADYSAPQPYTQDEEAGLLSRQIEALQNTLQSLQQRLNALKKED